MIKVFAIILFIFLAIFSFSLPWIKQENMRLNEMLKDKDEDDFRNQL